MKSINIFFNSSDKLDRSADHINAEIFTILNIIVKAFIYLFNLFLVMELLIVRHGATVLMKSFLIKIIMVFL